MPASSLLRFRHSRRATPHRRRALARLALLLPLALVACFDDPVEESVHLDFSANGSVEVTARTQIPADHLDSLNPHLRRRLQQRQQAMAEGWDGWPARFDAARPEAEEITFRRDQGRLVESSRRGTFADPGAVARFFADRVAATYTWDGDTETGELAFYPTLGGPATGGEVQQVERELDEWSDTAAGYLAAVADLYSHLQTYPERSEPAFRVLFADLLEEKRPTAAHAVLGEEGLRLVESVDDAMADLLTVLLVDDGEAFTFNELSRRVYDPFPGRVTVRPGGAVTEAVGFVETDGVWAVPRHDLWSAFSALEGRWVSPDPARAYVTASLAGDLDLDALLATGLTATAAPAPQEIRTALEEGLVPEAEYRLSWRSGG